MTPSNLHYEKKVFSSVEVVPFYLAKTLPQYCYPKLPIVVAYKSST